MRRRLAALVLLLCSAVLSEGCATTGAPYAPPPQPPEGKALVHFMRSIVQQAPVVPTTFSEANKDLNIQREIPK